MNYYKDHFLINKQIFFNLMENTFFLDILVEIFYYRCIKIDCKSILNLGNTWKISCFFSSFPRINIINKLNCIKNEFTY